MGSKDWDEDCMRWHGVVLTGEKAHWCPDWDYLPIDETTSEIDGCTCYEAAKGIPIWEVPENGCRFPIGENEHRHLFCGEPGWIPPKTGVREVYCQKHCKIAYRPLW